MASTLFASVRGQFNGDELDLRKELQELFDGTDFGREKKVIYILRTQRQDQFGDKILCSCFKKESGEGVRSCPHCDGYGFLWDEKIITGFKYPMWGNSQTTNGSSSRELGRRYDVIEKFITLYKYQLYEGDRIIEPRQNENGEIFIPVIPDNTWYVNFSTARRLDFGGDQYTDVLITKVQ